LQSFHLGSYLIVAFVLSNHLQHSPARFICDKVALGYVGDVQRSMFSDII
jgi:hypothetical protein